MLNLGYHLSWHGSVCQLPTMPECQTAVKLFFSSTFYYYYLEPRLDSLKNTFECKSKEMVNRFQRHKKIIFQ